MGGNGGTIGGGKTPAPSDGKDDSDSDNSGGILSNLSDLLEKVSGIPSAIIDGLGGILNGILSVVNVIGTVLSGIVDAIGNLLKSLFVPSDGFMDDKFNSVKKQLAARFDIGTYEELMKALQGYVAGKLDFGGYIDITMWDKKLPTIKNFIRAFFYPIILLGDFNFVIWLFRGTTFGSDISGGGGEKK